MNANKCFLIIILLLMSTLANAAYIDSLLNHQASLLQIIPNSQTGNLQFDATESKIAYHCPINDEYGIRIYDFVSNRADSLKFIGNCPSFSPNADRLAFLRDGQTLFIAELASGQETCILKGDIGTPQWSPDDNLISFIFNPSADEWCSSPDRDLGIYDVTNDTTYFEHSWHNLLVGMVATDWNFENKLLYNDHDGFWSYNFSTDENIHLGHFKDASKHTAGEYWLNIEYDNDGSYVLLVDTSRTIDTVCYRFSKEVYDRVKWIPHSDWAALMVHSYKSAPLEQKALDGIWIIDLSEMLE